MNDLKYVWIVLAVTLVSVLLAIFVGGVCSTWLFPLVIITCIFWLTLKGFQMRRTGSLTKGAVAVLSYGIFSMVLSVIVAIVKLKSFLSSSVDSGNLEMLAPILYTVAEGFFAAGLCSLLGSVMRIKDYDGPASHSSNDAAVSSENASLDHEAIQKLDGEMEKLATTVAKVDSSLGAVKTKADAMAMALLTEADLMKRIEMLNTSVASTVESQAAMLLQVQHLLNSIKAYFDRTPSN